jgi:hypothetical protein
MSLIILAPQAPKPAPEPIRPSIVVDRFDRKLVAAIEAHGDQPAPVWTLVHQIVADENPPSRTHRRMLVARLLCRLRGLLRAGRIEREGKAHVRLRKPGKPPTPAPTTPPKPLRNLPPAPDPTVGDWPAFQSGGPRTRTFRV